MHGLFHKLRFNKWMFSLYVLSVLFWATAESAIAHEFNVYMPTSLPACSARAFICEVPTKSFDSPGPFQYMPAIRAGGKAEPSNAPTLDAMGATACVDGKAGPFPCSNVDLLSFMPLSDIGGGRGNDIWGWTDLDTGKEYALMGRTNGTAFVDISEPENPIYIGNLPSQHEFEIIWRDIKVYDNHAFVVIDIAGSDTPDTLGMQVFDLTQLRESAIRDAQLPLTFSATALYTDIYGAHNIAINEESGFAYAVGTRGAESFVKKCGSGLHMIDISTPTSPTFAGCFEADGYTHDTQCVNYIGPDADYQGREICFNSNEDTLTIVDVTDKTNPVQISRVWYESACDAAGEIDPNTSCFGNFRFYTHQGWLTDDQRYFLQDDEFDESGFDHNTRTYIWDVQDLDNPIYARSHTSHIEASDHNQYVHDNYVYQANYQSGLRILDAANIAADGLFEVAFFDIYPANNETGFKGAWSNYPFFDSGIVIVSGKDEGLFMVRPNLSRVAVTRTYMPFIWQE